ncbi:MAG: VanZ family protein, partial [Fimbriimonadales bacterium]
GYWAFWRSFGMERAHALRWAIATSLLRAVIDEIHQAFVPGRTGTPVDVLIDAVGIALAAWLIRRRSLRQSQ